FWKLFSDSRTFCELEPGISKPPLVRLSVWWSVKGIAATRIATQPATRRRARRSTNASIRSIARCTFPCLPVGWLAGQPILADDARERNRRVREIDHARLCV